MGCFHKQANTFAEFLNFVGNLYIIKQILLHDYYYSYVFN